FQAEDGIRDATVTGVQTCALPISPGLNAGPGGGRGGVVAHAHVRRHAHIASLGREDAQVIGAAFGLVKVVVDTGDVCPGDLSARVVHAVIRVPDPVVDALDRLPPLLEREDAHRHRAIRGCDEVVRERVRYAPGQVPAG